MIGDRELGEFTVSNRVMVTSIVHRQREASDEIGRLKAQLTDPLLLMPRPRGCRAELAWHLDHVPACRLSLRYS